MRIKLLTVAIAATLSAATASAQLPAENQISPDSFRAHVAFLADDLLEGREAGSRGYDIAARYVASQFEALGVTPGANGSWFQPVEFVRFGLSGRPRLTIGGREFTQGEGILVRPSPEAEALALDLPLVFAGYGLDLPARGYDDYSGLDVRGKVVVVFNGYPPGTPSDVGAHLLREKARMAALRGAVGMITLRSRTEIEATPWQRLAAGNRPSTTWVETDGRPYVEHGLRFSAVVEGEAAQTLFAGSRRTLDQLLDQAARRNGRLRGFAMPQRFRIERAAAETGQFSSANVVGIIPGTDPALAGEYVVLMAHLDGLGIRPEGSGGATGGGSTGGTSGGTSDLGSDRIRNGAMDNATGVATLIEVARQFAGSNRPRRPILLAAVTAEEKGLLGAEYLARHPVIGQGRVVSVVNLDMPILTYDFSDVIAFGAEHSTMGPVVARAAARMNVALAPDPLPGQNLFVRSDHYKFVREGVPSVFLMTGFAGDGRQMFTSFLDAVYHTPQDDMRLPFNWNAAARFAQLNYLITREIADGDTAPAWYADSFFGQVFGGSQRRAERPPEIVQAARR